MANSPLFSIAIAAAFGHGPAAWRHYRVSQQDGSLVLTAPRAQSDHTPEIKITYRAAPDAPAMVNVVVTQRMEREAAAGLADIYASVSAMLDWLGATVPSMAPLLYANRQDGDCLETDFIGALDFVQGTKQFRKEVD